METAIVNAKEAINILDKKREPLHIIKYWSLSDMIHILMFILMLVVAFSIATFYFYETRHILFDL
jgi:hypothetical protein